jgi:uncharacterized protein
MKTVLITGASSGIGEAFAKELGKSKTNLVLVARSEEKLQQLAQSLREQYAIQVEVIVQDLVEPNAASKIFEAVQQKQMIIDGLINNAGFGDYNAFHNSSRQKLLEMIQLNVLALVDLTYQFLPGMQAQASGTIINISSIAGFIPIPYMSVYAATKAFVISFSQSLWAENKDTGVDVLVVCPGPTETQFFDRAGFAKPGNNDSNSPSITTPEQVVQETLEALKRKKITVVTGGIQTKIITNIPRFCPRKLLVSMIEKQFRPKG